MLALLPKIRLKWWWRYSANDAGWKASSMRPSLPDREATIVPPSHEWRRIGAGRRAHAVPVKRDLTNHGHAICGRGGELTPTKRYTLTCVFCYRKLVDLGTTMIEGKYP